MAKLWLLFLLLSILPTQNNSQSVVTVNRCCPPSQTLSKTRDRCVTAQTPQDQPRLPLPALNKGTFGLVAGRPGHGDVQVDVEKVAMPGCGKTEAHLLGSEAWLTEKGRLVTGRYEAGFPLGEFCLERDVDENMVAVMCDPCQGRICLNVCCPHGKIYQPSDDYEIDPDSTFHDECVEPEEPEPWSPQFWNDEEEVELELERHSQYVLKLDERTPNGAFYCQNDSILPYDVLFETFQLNDKGMAKAVFYENKTTKTFDSSQFCVTYSDLDYDEDTEIKNVTYFICNYFEDKDDNKCVVNADFYSASLIISIIFLLLTIIAHSLLPQLHSNMIGKMTIGFLINMCISYICITYLYLVRDSLDTLVGTTRCNFLGYLIQYSFLAFFFWQNSMAAYIFLKTTNIIHLNIYHDTKQFIIFFIFSQICPFFVSIATAIVDIQVNDYESSVHVKPNMGAFSCFLGNEYQEPPLPYVETAEFVYFHSFMIVIIILNVIYFTITLALLYLARNSSGGGMTKNHIRIVLTLFFLMGIPWISEIINGVAQNHLSCGVQIFLDVINLFAGPLIFLVLVVKKDILMSLKNILMCRNGPSGVSRDNFGMTSLT